MSLNAKPDDSDPAHEAPTVTAAPSIKPTAPAVKPGQDDPRVQRPTTVPAFDGAVAKPVLNATTTELRYLIPPVGQTTVNTNDRKRFGPGGT